MELLGVVTDLELLAVGAIESRLFVTRDSLGDLVTLTRVSRELRRIASTPIFEPLIISLPSNENMRRYRTYRLRKMLNIRDLG